MSLSLLTTFLALFLALLVRFGQADYTLSDDYGNSASFFDRFQFFTGQDPTNGFVEYVDRNTAQDAGLIYAANGAVHMGVDNSNTAPNGRHSVRVTSTSSYQHGLFILDLAHMPGSVCGTWPAFWLVGADWPSNGEIDIIEGVNTQIQNDMTLHTSDGCAIEPWSGFTGSLLTSNCYVNAPGQSANTGCQIQSTSGLSYGTPFNANGGGVYATEWTSNGISIWFFPRWAIPADITAGSNPDPSTWGAPAAKFTGSGCDWDSHFNNLQIVFDITFCGDWAGGAWGSSCSASASTCQDFVANNPWAFQETYWAINSLKVYQQQQQSWSKRDGDGNVESDVDVDVNAGDFGSRNVTGGAETGTVPGSSPVPGRVSRVHRRYMRGLHV